MRKRREGAPFVDRRGFLAGGLACATPGVALARTSATDALDRFVTGEMAQAGIPGLALGLARNGAVRLARGYGFADLERRRRATVDTLFHIASVTKVVTATAVMRLAEAGRLDLDGPVAPHLDFPLANPAHPDRPITFRQLLSHTSSLSDARYYEIDFRVLGADAPKPLGEMLRGYLTPGGAHYSPKRCFSAAAPGEAWDYCNVGYGLLGYLAGRIGGEDMRERTQREIFDRLGAGGVAWRLADAPERLRATPYDLVDGKRVATAPVGLPDWPAGNLRASIAGFTRFVAACANDGATADGVRILGAETMAEMRRPAKPPSLPTWLSGQALGWMESPLAGRPLLNHWGGDPGVFTAAYVDPASRLGVAIFTNLSAVDPARAAIKAIAARLLELPPPPS
ncbi:serine hydrolase domain-containing protein [Caulobacter mirabilis]|uniref:Serine hydrolase n=1 Tax=Caulobacter mirabilis TaxID=69666 RepID=A0A2D2AYH6_9CAUL|nr:serine hydrolase domain-containing protein [Caulobacter mirabilis]ATQ43035.1 serine hydrolase [Caulobacter mirabilis]